MTADASPTIIGISHIDLTVTDLARSEQFYTDLLGLRRVLDGRNDVHHLSSIYLVHPATLLILGLVQHDEGHGAFDECHVGLDHLSFAVSSRDELNAWAVQLTKQGIEHSLISESDLWDVLVLRDPDNIQLELFYMKPAAADLLV